MRIRNLGALSRNVGLRRGAASRQPDGEKGTKKSFEGDVALTYAQLLRALRKLI